MLTGVDPRAKLVGVLVLMLPLLLDPAGSTVLFYLGVLGIGFGLDTRARDAARQLRPTLWLGLGLVLFTGLVAEEERRWLAGLVPWSPTGALGASILALRMIELVALGLLLTTTTPPRQLLDGLEWLLRPLRALRVDVQTFGLLAMLVLRFVPVFRSELTTTERAMFLRGVRFGRGPLEQARRLAALGIPAISRLLIRSDDLATGLVSRGFGLAPPPARPTTRFGRGDLVFLCGCLLAVAVPLVV